jgi:hypothetical protein
VSIVLKFTLARQESWLDNQLKESHYIVFVNLTSTKKFDMLQCDMLKNNNPLIKLGFDLLRCGMLRKARACDGDYNVEYAKHTSGKCHPCNWPAAFGKHSATRFSYHYVFGEHYP